MIHTATHRLAPLSLSRLMLGTVQFGLNYGIGNRQGQPSYDTAKEILSFVAAHGVNGLDTAAGYGTSEEVLGRALGELNLREHFRVVTKIKHLPADLTRAEADAAVEASVSSSLERLQLRSLDVCLFHVEGNAVYLPSLLKLKERGWVRHIGVSVSTPGGAQSALASGDIDALQVPINILDRRFDEVIASAAASGIAIFARSVYLQGLLLMEEAAVPAELADILPIQRKLAGIAKENSMTLSELCMRYVLGVPAVTSVLVGVDSLAQARENLSLFSKGALSADLVAAVDAVVPSLPETVLNPILWPKKR